MNSKETEALAKIKEGPYFSVRFQPARPLDLSLQRCEELVKENAVRLRGWDFPHYNYKGAIRDQKYVGGHVDWENHIELWRMYRSGQFVYFGSSWDTAMDWQARLRKEFEHSALTANEAQKAEIVGLFSFVGIIYAVTEFYVFAARLAKALESPSIRLEVSMKNVENWALVSGEPAVWLSSFYPSRTPNIEVEESELERLLGDPVASAALGLKEIFELFSWDNSAAAIEQWQNKFMAGRFAF